MLWCQTDRCLFSSSVSAFLVVLLQMTRFPRPGLPFQLARSRQATAIALLLVLCFVYANADAVWFCKSNIGNTLSSVCGSCYASFDKRTNMPSKMIGKGTDGVMEHPGDWKGRDGVLTTLRRWLPFSGRGCYRHDRRLYEEMMTELLASVQDFWSLIN